MQNLLIDTIVGIIITEFPKNDQEQLVLSDGVAIHSIFAQGKEPLDAQKTPNIIIQNGEYSGEFAQFAYSTDKYEIIINMNVQDHIKKSGRILVNEMQRLVVDIIKSHSIVYCMVNCPLCDKIILSPEHYTIVHTAIMAPYVLSAQAAADAEWARTNTSSTPAIRDDLIAAAAIQLMYEDVNDLEVPTGMSTLQRDNVLTYKLRNQRLFGIVTLIPSFAVSPTSEGEDKGIFTRSLKVTYKEITPIMAWGPNNVSTSNWA